MNRKMLWLLSGAAALILAVILVAVLQKEPAQEQELKKLPQIALCLRRYEEDPEYGQLLETKFKEAGFRVTLLDAQNDQTRQTEQIRDVLKEEPALLVIEPVITDASDAAVSLLAEKNIPAVFIGSKPEALTGGSRLTYVGSADSQLGTLQGSIVLHTASQGDLNEDGQISCLVITGPEDDIAAQAQAQDSIDALVQEGLLVEQVEISWGDRSFESGQARCAKALAQYGKDIEVILCGSEEITLGALEAVHTGGWELDKDYILVGAGAEDALQSEHMTGTVFCDWEAMAQQVFSAAQALIAGDPVKQEYYVNLKALKAERK